MLGLVSKTQSPTIQPVIDSGHNVKILPADKYGMFRLPRERVPITIPLQVVNVCDPTEGASGAIDPLPVIGQPHSKKFEIATLDMEPNDLAQLRFIVLDSKVSIEFGQPAVNNKFNNQGTGSLRWTKANTVPFIEHDMHSLIPEVFVMGNQSRITLTAYNMDPNESVDLARVAFLGYKYQLIPINEAQAEDQYMTISVGMVKN